jgi:hypothetical protein
VLLWLVIVPSLESESYYLFTFNSSLILLGAIGVVMLFKESLFLDLILWSVLLLET